MSQISGEADRSPELDGIRGLAILGVLCSHGAGLSGLFLDHGVASKLFRYCMVPLWGGVDLFFALSGFLITGILLRTKSSERYFTSFYARRALRIFPIYYLAIVVSLICARYSAMVARQLPPAKSWIVSFFFYMQNWPVFWHGEKMMSGLWGAYWSLAVEEQFYLLWPLIVFSFSPKLVARICIVGFACALPLRALLSVYAFGDSFGLAQITPSRVDALLLGAGCSIYMYLYKRPVPGKWIFCTACAGAAITFYIAVFHHTEFVGTGRWMSTLGITGFALLAGSLVSVSQYRVAPIHRILTFPALCALGKYSYGLYVYHLLILLPLSWIVVRRPDLVTNLNFGIRFALLLAELTVVFLVSKLSYEKYESYFLGLKKYFRPGRELRNHLIPAPDLAGSTSES